MILTFLIILLITCGGTALTYLYEKEDSLMTRLAAGNVVGSAIFATVGFLLACFFGLSIVTVLIAILLTLVPLILFREKKFKHRLDLDWQKARSRTHGTSYKKILRVGYYIFFFLLFVFFFDRAMLDRPDGIFTGGSQNLGDLPFHLGAIFSFTEGNNFPPENPSFTGAKFTYPFLADFVTACFVKLGASVRDAMFVQNVFLGFSLVILLEKFTRRLTNNKTAGKIAPMLLFFSGGLGFVWFFKDYWQGAQSFFEILWKLPQDYTIGEKFRWGNSLVVLFLTQRSLLFGMPLALIALTKIWEIFSSEKVEKVKSEKASEITDENFFTLSHFHFSTFLVGLLAGTLVLIHVHSLVALFVVCAFLFFLRLDKWREWIAFAVGVSIIAVPELLWSLTGSASNLSKFIEPFFGWDSKDQNFVMFWAKNIGLFAPILIAGIILIYLTQKDSAEDLPKAKDQKTKTKDHAPNAENLLLFYLPFAFLFLVSNTFKLAPWEWDNIKVLIYWFVGSLPFAAFALA